MIFSMRKMPRDEFYKIVQTEAYFVWSRRKAKGDQGADNADENWAKAEFHVGQRYEVED